MIPMDNIHYNFRSINGYNKPINIVISPREPGKTSMAWMQLVYLPYKKTGKPWIYFVRQTNEITEALITSIEDIFNKFTPHIPVTNPYAANDIIPAGAKVAILKKLIADGQARAHIASATSVAPMIKPPMIKNIIYFLFIISTCPALPSFSAPQALFHTARFLRGSRQRPFLSLFR